MRSKETLSTPSPARLATWRLFFESSLALADILDGELRREIGISLRWYDVLVHLEESPEGMRMNELADRILTSKSGLTRVIDNMAAAGLVERVRPEGDRRAILVHQTVEGVRALARARPVHRHGIEQHFARHLTDAEARAFDRALAKVRSAVRPLRPGRVKD